ncbi:MAG TPA: hypothetical protein VH950_16515 [Gaiellaceae bacterium]
MTWLIWIPLILLGTLLVLTLLLVFLSRFRGGKLLRPIVQFLSKIPFMRRWFQRMSVAAYERTNPELASAIKKIQAFGEPKTPEQAQRALALLTPAERKAYLEAVGGEAVMPEATNREQRRRVERGAQGMVVQQRPGSAGRRPKKRR